jgi:hypothetical protein
LIKSGKKRTQNKTEHFISKQQVKNLLKICNIEYNKLFYKSIMCIQQTNDSANYFNKDIVEYINLYKIKNLVFDFENCGKKILNNINDNFVITKKLYLLNTIKLISMFKLISK